MSPTLPPSPLPIGRPSVAHPVTTLTGVPAAPATTIDSTALLATLVQSGAALVAIIAGLLVARLVALAGERTALERRVKELREDREDRIGAVTAARADLLRDEALDFIEDILGDYIGADCVGEVADFMAGYSGTRTAEEFEPYFAEFRQRVSEIKQALDYDSLVTELPVSTAAAIC